MDSSQSSGKQSPVAKANNKNINAPEHKTRPRTRSGGSARKAQLRGRASPTGSTGSSGGSSYNRPSSRSASPAEDAILRVKVPLTSTPRHLGQGDGAVAGPSHAQDFSSHPRPHSLSQSRISVQSQHSGMDENGSRSSSLSIASSGTHSTNNTHDSQVDLDLDLSEVAVPIVGYEIMEERARFTIFKIHVQRSAQDDWYIFRRYSDFLRLNDSLKELFPHFRLALPPKKWFGDNFDRNFLDDRQLGLQAFLNNIISHRDVRQSEPVREFFCFDDPPGPHDSLEESRAQCERLEEQAYTLRHVVQERDARIALLEEEINLHKAEIENLRKALRIERSLNNNRRASPSSRSESSLPEQDQASFTEADQSSETKSSCSVISKEDSSATSWDVTSDVARDLKLTKNHDTDSQAKGSPALKGKTTNTGSRTKIQSNTGMKRSDSQTESPKRKVTLSVKDDGPSSAKVSGNAQKKTAAKEMC